jgi:hypothetical protein
MQKSLSRSNNTAEVVTQEDIEEFKKQIQTDLQKLAHALEQNTIK